MISNSFSVRRVAYFFLVYLPSGFLAFFSPTLFISTLSDISYTITAQKGYMTYIYWGYQHNLSAMIYIASVFGIINILKFKFVTNRFNKNIMLIVLSIYVFFSSFISNIVFYRIIDRSFFFNPIYSLITLVENKNKMIEESNILLNLVDDNYLLAAANNFFYNNNVLHRKNIILFCPPPFRDADYLLLNKNMRRNHIYKPQHEEYGIIKFNEFLSNYEIVELTENYILYTRIDK